MVATLLANSPWARANWLVLAPHADDETLGAGALLAEIVRSGRLAAIAYLTDGAGSHPLAGTLTRRRLVMIREREARLAVRRLGGRQSPSPIFLRWPDANPYRSDQSEYRRSRDRLSALCRACRIDAIAVTAPDEAHCDHQASFDLASAVSRHTGRPIALFVYRVWSEPPRANAQTIRTASLPPGVRRHALQSHRSQLTTWLGDGFRLPSQKMHMPDHDHLTLWTNRDAA